MLIRNPVSNVQRIRILYRIVLDPSSVHAASLDPAYPTCLFARGNAVRFGEYAYMAGISCMEERGANLNYRLCVHPTDQTEQQGDERFGSRNPLSTQIIFGLYGEDGR